MPRKTLEERFWEKVDRQAHEDCWPWLGRQSAKGYGLLAANNTDIRAHRFAYEFLVGPIPGGLCLDHRCENRSCVNPAHLEPATLAENTMRGDGPPAQNARKTHCLRGHAYDKENTYIDSRGWRLCRTCARLRKRASRQRIEAANA